MRTRLVIPAAVLVAAAYERGRQTALAARPAPLRGFAPPVDVRRRAEAEAADAWELTHEPPVVAPAPSEPLPAGEPIAWERPEPADWDVPELPEAVVWAAAPQAPPAPVVVAEPAPVVDAEPAGPDLAAVAEWCGSPAPSPRPAPAPPAPETVIAEWWTAVAPPAPAPGHAEVVVEESGRFSLGGWASQPGHMALCGVTFRDRRAGAVDPASIRLLPDAVSNVADGGVLVLTDAGFAPDAEGFTLLVSAAGPGSFAAAGRYELVAA